MKRRQSRSRAEGIVHFLIVLLELPVASLRETLNRLDLSRLMGTSFAVGIYSSVIEVETVIFTET